MNPTPTRLAAALITLAFIGLDSLAETYTWNPGTTGNWTVGTNWDSPPPTTGNHDILVDNETSNSSVLTANQFYNGANYLQSLTISSGDTLIWAAQIGINNLNNAGTIRGTGQVLMQTSTGTFTNSGTIEANGGTLTLPYYGTAALQNVTNTGGTVRAINGGTLQPFNNDLKFTGGNFTVDGTSSVSINQGGGWLVGYELENVTATNAGNWNLSNHATNSSSNAAYTNLTGTTTFANSGTISLLNQTNNSGDNDVYFSVGANASLTTTGTSQITISRTGTTDADYEAYLKLDASGTAFTNNGSITISSAAGAAGSAQLRSGRNIINNGTINIAGPVSSIELSDGAGLTVSSSGTLSGEGAITGPTVIQGTHSPGNSPGIQTVDGNLTYSGGSSIVEWELISNATTVRGVDFDGIDVSGNLDFAAATALNLVFNLGSSVDWTDGFWNVPNPATVSWLLYDVAGETTGFSNLNLVTEDWLDSNGLAFSSALPKGYFQLAQEGSDIVLKYGQIPEPASAVLLGLAGLLALRRRR